MPVHRTKPTFIFSLIRGAKALPVEMVYRHATRVGGVCLFVMMYVLFEISVDAEMFAHFETIIFTLI